MSWYTRWASKATQKAHARVTKENARYVREAIEKDAENERLAQERDAARLEAAERLARIHELERERDQARTQADDCQKQGVTLARTLRQQLASIKDVHVRQLAQRDELIARMDAELTEVSGQLQDAQERLALVDREEDMRDEIRAKRASDL